MRNALIRGAVVLAAALLAVCTAAAAERAAEPWAACAECHDDLARAFAGTPHAASPAGCEGCHGPGQEHIQGQGDVTKIRRFETLSGGEVAEVCLGCHQKGRVVNWMGGTHEVRKLDCLKCHNPHPGGAVPVHLLRQPEPTLCGGCHPTERTKFLRSGHMPLREGRLTCTSCHNPHGTVNERLLDEHSINETCYSCHAEKRGPFLWEHPPVREGCTTCHDPHGSVQEGLLKVKQPILCQSCHVSSRHPSQPHAPVSRFAFNQGCYNCHPMIHGSNHPSGVRFMR